MQQPKPVIVSQLFPELLEELLDLLGGLSKDEWDTATICTPWTVKDISLHLLGSDIGNLSWKRDGCSVFTEIESFAHFVELINQHNARWVESTQHFSPELLIEMLNFIGEQVTEHFQSLDPFELGVPVDWVGPDPALIWLDLAREYTERWHHQQHIRDAVGKPGLKDARFLGPILDAFILALPKTFRDVIAEADTAIQISTTGAVKRDWILKYHASEWWLYEGDVDMPQASVSIPDDIAWRIFTKGIPIENAIQQVRLSGNLDLAAMVLETISLID